MAPLSPPALFLDVEMSLHDSNVSLARPGRRVPTEKLIAHRRCFTIYRQGHPATAISPRKVSGSRPPDSQTMWSAEAFGQANPFGAAAHSPFGFASVTRRQAISQWLKNEVTRRWVRCDRELLLRI